MVSKVNANEALAMIKSGDAILVDVREPDEFKSEHIAYAISVPLSSLEDSFKSLDLPADKTILFQCLKGMRGENACQIIQGSDHCSNNVVNIDGGIEAWKKSDLPVISSSDVDPVSAALLILRQAHVILGSLIAITAVLAFIGVTKASIVTGIIGCGLFTAGVTGWCGLSILLSKMPWNKHLVSK